MYANLRITVLKLVALISAATVCLQASICPVCAANLWDGGGANDNWGTALNWDTDLVPVFPQAITFGGTTRLTPNNNLTSITVNGITFDPTAGAFVVGGNSVVLGGDIVDNSAVPQRINNSLALGATRTVTVPTGGNLTIGGAITGVGKGITKVGDGKLTLLGANSYSGPITIGSTTANGGTVFIGAGGTLGNGTNALNIGGFSGTTPVAGTACFDRFCIYRQFGSDRQFRHCGQSDCLWRLYDTG